MTNEPITKLAALGQAWSGDWRARIVDRLHARGLDSVTALGESRPNASLIELADELSTDQDARVNYADLAAEQLVQIWRAEAQSGGPVAIERFARRLLVGELHRYLPEGWRAEWSSDEARPAMSRMTAATSAWTCHLSKEHQPGSDRVFSALLRAGKEGQLPTGWLPADADDPLLVELFRCHWAT